MPKEIKTCKKNWVHSYNWCNSRVSGNKIKFRDIKYWTYHHDDEHFAIVLISNTVLE